MKYEFIEFPGGLTARYGRKDMNHDNLKNLTDDPCTQHLIEENITDRELTVEELKDYFKIRDKIVSKLANELGELRSK
jgi:hypothetical protein